jgi:hypothetical protein
MPHVDPHHETARNTLRMLGAALLALGSLTAIVGLARFVSLFGGNPFAPDRPNPALAVLMFGGGGMVAMLGLKLLFLGYAGRILRYGMAETLPPTLDAARAATPVAREVAREIAVGVRDGLHGEVTSRSVPLRHICGTENDPGARFCQGCGVALAVTPAQCPKCRSSLDPGDAYCAACGAATAPERDV